MTSKLRLIACTMVVFLLQVCVAHRFSYRYFSADLLSLLAVYVALEGTLPAALWTALGIGLLRDFSSLGRLGSSAVLFVLGCALLLFVRGRVFRQGLLTDLLLVFAFVLLTGLVQAAGVALWSRGGQLPGLILSVLGQATYTAALSPIFFFCFEKAGLADRRGEGEYAF